MKERLIEVFKRTFMLNEVNENISQKNCSKWDSLNHLNLIIELETEFDISFEPEEIALMKTLNDIEKIIKKKI